MATPQGLVLAASAHDVVQKLLRAARKGTRVIYIPGNHDALSRQFIGLSFGGIEIKEDDIHATARGLRLWITHGDLFDAVMQHATWLAHLGGWLYEFLLRLNGGVNALRLRLGLPYWSMSLYVKHHVKNAGVSGSRALGIAQCATLVAWG